MFRNSLVKNLPKYIVNINGTANSMTLPQIIKKLNVKFIAYDKHDNKIDSFSWDSYDPQRHRIFVKESDLVKSNYTYW